MGELTADGRTVVIDDSLLSNLMAILSDQLGREGTLQLMVQGSSRATLVCLRPHAAIRVRMASPQLVDDRAVSDMQHELRLLGTLTLLGSYG